MKALSLLQPWASLIMLGYKQYETRSWATKHRGPLAIAASVGKQGRALCGPGTDLGQLLANHGLTFDDLPRGAILGVCQVESMHKMDETWDLVLGDVELACGDYSNGRYAWALSRVQAFATPIPCKGALSLWEVPEAVEEQFPLSSAPVPALAAQEMIPVRTYQFDKGYLHLERATADGMSREEIEEMYGPILSQSDGEMPADAFFDLPDFREI